jgi:hypothetical protein
MLVTNVSQSEDNTNEEKVQMVHPTIVMYYKTLTCEVPE